jgi:hypothetical protein
MPQSGSNAPSIASQSGTCRHWLIGDVQTASQHQHAITILGRQCRIENILEIEAEPGGGRECKVVIEFYSLLISDISWFTSVVKRLLSLLILCRLSIVPCEKLR